MGQPQLPAVNISGRATSPAVADWIMRNVPSFVGLIPHEWTEAVIRKLRQYAIQNEVIREAFRITRSNKMDFEAPFGYSMAELKLIFPARPESPVSRQVRDTAPHWVKSTPANGPITVSGRRFPKWRRNTSRPC